MIKIIEKLNALLASTNMYLMSGTELVTKDLLNLKGCFIENNNSIITIDIQGEVNPNVEVFVCPKGEYKITPEKGSGIDEYSVTRVNINPKTKQRWQIAVTKYSPIVEEVKKVLLTLYKPGG